MRFNHIMAAAAACAVVLSPLSASATGQASGARPTERPAAGPVTDKDGVWDIAVGKTAGVCFAQAAVDDSTYLQLLAVQGRVGLAVGSDGPLPQGHKGRIQTDAYAFDFAAGYGSPRYMSSDGPFDAGAVVALQRAKWIRVEVDGQVLLNASLEGSGFPDVLDSVAACSRGEKGWWGEGAAKS
jgi:hypothetical protein